MQIAIPYMHFRGGSSKGLFFNAKDLPTDETVRNQYILAALEGSDKGDPRQIDGLGGGSSLSSKVAIVSPSDTEGVDLDYYFVQVMIGKGKVSTNQTCGNILAGVLPFAIESGMLTAAHPTTRAVINIVNTGGQCEVVVETPNGQVNYAGHAKVDGVLGTAAPIFCNYLDTEGATCGALFPTGNTVDVVDGKEITCIDNGMPVILVRASDFNITGYETKEALDNNAVLKQQLENIRLKMGFKMNLGDVSTQSVPKMCLIAPPQYGGVVATRMFIPHVCHDAIGVLAAVSVATACVFPKTIAEGIATMTGEPSLSVEHPTGEMTVYLEKEKVEDGIKIKKSGVMRTARLLSKGWVFIPERT
ncbi:MAG: 4-oxalomesaconate tautomerase [Saprospiraceae bacterium]|nr:4-oxalomesaconate tautomerase [Saprospiraceae bacterium]